MKTRTTSYKTRLSIYFFIAIALVVVIAGSLLYVNVKRVMENETVGWNLKTIIQLKNSTEMMLDEIDHSLNQLSFDSDIQSFANLYDQATYKDIGDVIEKINNTSAANTFVRSLYVYYFKSGKVLDARNSRFTTLDSLADREFITEAWKMSKTETALKQFMFYVINTSGKKNILTIVKPVNISLMHPEALLIVTVDPNYLEELLDSIKINEKASVYVITGNESVISAMNRQYPEFIRQIDMHKKSMIENNDSGYFITKINGQDYLVTFATSKQFGWKYYYTIPTKEIYRKIDFVGEYIILLLVICLLLGGVVSRLFASKLYVPISGIVKELRKNSPAVEKGLNDDMTYINANIKSLVSSNRSLKESLDESMPILKNLFLLRVLRNELDNNEPFWDRMRFYNAQINEGCFYNICVIEIDSYNTIGTSYSEKQKSMLEIYQKEIINDLCSKQAGIGAELVKTDAHAFILIIGVACKNAQEADSRVMELASGIHSGMSGNMKFTVTIGIGKATNDAGRIHDTYIEACRAPALL